MNDGTWVEVEMSCPLMLEMDDRPLDAIIDALQGAGIRVERPPQWQSDAREAELICRRGRASFAMSMRRGQDQHPLSITFAADLSRWRWWNFPVMWLLGIPFTGQEIQLQTDAYGVLRGLGAARIGGGDVLFLEDEHAAQIQPGDGAPRRR